MHICLSQTVRYNKINKYAIAFILLLYYFSSYNYGWPFQNLEDAGIDFPLFC